MTTAAPSKKKARKIPTVKLAAMAAKYNPRLPASKKLMRELRASLREFGIVQPVVVNARTDTVVGGHKRIQAAAEEGLASLPVLWVDVDVATEKRMNLALNKIGGTWDDRLLKDILLELDGLGESLEASGFSPEELAKLTTAPTVPAMKDDPLIPRSEVYVELRGSSSDLEDWIGTLQEWSQADGVTLDIS